MIIDISLVLTHILIFGLCYAIPWLFYRFILRPNFRWTQKGNVCYEYAFTFAFVTGLILVGIIYIFYHTNIFIFKW